MKKMNKKGFTLVEMLVVIAIIAILVSILIPTVLGATKKAKAATDAANLRSAVAEYEIWALTNGKLENVSGEVVSADLSSAGITAPACKSLSSDNTFKLTVNNGVVDGWFGSLNIKDFARVAENGGELTHQS